MSSQNIIRLPTYYKSLLTHLEYRDGILYTSNSQLVNNTFKGLDDGYFKSMQLFPNNISELIDAESGEQITDSNLLKRCTRTAMEMRSRRINNESVVCICSYNHLDSCVPFIAAQFLGAKTCSLDPVMNKQLMAHLIGITRPNMFFVVPECVQTLEEALKEVELKASIVVFGESKRNVPFREFMMEKEDEDDFVPYQTDDLKETGVVMFSSGTTGLPKGICLGHVAFLKRVDLGDLSVTLAFTSLYWLIGVIFLSNTILQGTTRVISKSYDVEKAWDYIENYRLTFLFMSTALSYNFSRARQNKKGDTSSLEIFMNGGAPPTPQLLMDLRHQLPGTFVTQCYGQTEGGGISSMFYPNDENIHLKKLMSCGQPLRGMTFRIVDLNTEKVLGCNQQGELRIKTDTAMVGYYNMDSSSAWDAEGWLKTGDLAYYDEDFCLYIVDRFKEMLKYKSFQVTPGLIQSITLTHPSVKECVVFGVPHEIDGDHPAALVVLKNEAPKHIVPRDVLEYTNKRVDEKHFLRGGLEFVQHLLYTPTGKVRRAEMRNLYIQGLLYTLFNESY